MSNENENSNAGELFPLDEAAITMLSEVNAQIRNLQFQWQGALVLFLRQHGLKGNWIVHENGRELIRREPVPTTMEQKP